MKADELYGWLVGSCAASACDPFDCHVVGAILALAAAEAQDSGRPLLDGLGLTKGELLALAGEMFPAARAVLDGAVADRPVDLDGEEQSLRDILSMYCSRGDALERRLVAMIARRCKSPHHLWQDLGLRNRGELSALMQRHFAPLAQKNSGDMKWKKFLYRMVCGAEGFTLCTAPVCSECDDFQACFGAEDGESRLARIRNGAPPAEKPSRPVAALEIAPH